MTLRSPLYILGGLALLMSACGAAPPPVEQVGSAGLEPTSRAVRGATDRRAKVRFTLRGRRLTLVYGGPEKRSSTGYALHNNRVGYACYRSLWASIGQDEPRGAGVARARTTMPFGRGAKRKTVVLSRDLSGQAGACVVESLRLNYRFDAAVGMFVSSPEFVRRDAPGAPDLAARPGERLLDGSLVGTRGASLFLGERTLRIVLADDAPPSIQRDFRTQALNVFCSDRTGVGPGQGTTQVRFPPRSREVIARFARTIAPADGVTCGAETETTGTEAFGSIGAPVIVGD